MPPTSWARARATSVFLVVLSAGLAGCVDGNRDEDRPVPTTTVETQDATSRLQAPHVPVAPDPARKTDAASFARMEDSLDRLQDHMAAALDATTAERWDEAFVGMGVVLNDLRSLNRDLLSNGGLLDAHDQHIVEVGLSVMAQSVEALRILLQWLMVITKAGADFEAAAPGSEAANVALRTLADSYWAGERGVAVFDDVASRMGSIVRQEPDVAAAFGWTLATEAEGHQIASGLHEANQQLSEAVAQARSEANYAPPAPIAPPITERPPPTTDTTAASTTYDAVALETRFAGFDTTGDDALDAGEAEAFFNFVDTSIDFRYDDEGVVDPLPETVVGDGRVGADYTQAPQETYRERAGDCEDTSRLEAAFYEYWGVEAYIALVDVEGSEAPAAVTLVFAGATAEEARKAMGTVVLLEIPADDASGLPPGAYLVLDHCGSDFFGLAIEGADPTNVDVVKAVDADQRLEPGPPAETVIVPEPQKDSRAITSPDSPFSLALDAALAPAEVGVAAAYDLCGSQPEAAAPCSFVRGGTPPFRFSIETLPCGSSGPDGRPVWFSSAGCDEPASGLNDPEVRYRSGSYPYSFDLDGRAGRLAGTPGKGERGEYLLRVCVRDSANTEACTLTSFQVRGGAVKDLGDGSVTHSFVWTCSAILMSAVHVYGDSADGTDEAVPDAQRDACMAGRTSAGARELAVIQQLPAPAHGGAASVSSKAVIEGDTIRLTVSGDAQCGEFMAGIFQAATGSTSLGVKLQLSNTGTSNRVVEIGLVGLVSRGSPAAQSTHTGEVRARVIAGGELFPWDGHSAASIASGQLKLLSGQERSFDSTVRYVLAPGEHLVNLQSWIHSNLQSNGCPAVDMGATSLQAALRVL